jgi:acetyltransferase-like isoleucine patch superfamily enzyme
MDRMRRLVEKIIAKLKNDPSYRIDGNYSTKQLLFILYYRAIQIVLGYLAKLKISTKGMMFCGRRVILLHGYQVTAGRNLILENDVYLNALSKNGILLGDNVTIAKYSVLVCTGVIANLGVGIKIGNNSAIGAQSFLGGQGGILIGNDVIMGPQVKIFSENHNFESIDIVIRKQGESRLGVSIGDNCWIGAGVTILDGVSIGEGCIIAAGSIVTSSLPKNCIAMGVPAKNIKSRNST